jgi:CheY-like chemotaxis protein
MAEAAVLPISASALAGVRVLVIDDEADARDLVTTVLGQYAAQTAAAASAAAALETIELWRPHVLVIDIAMPGEDGYDLIRRVRALSAECGGHVPAIALTAYARPEDRARAVAAGYQIHMPKPVEPNHLATVVASLARRNAAA